MSNLSMHETPESLSDSLREAAKKVKPPVFELDGGQLPFERLSPEHFELLIADLYRERQGAKGWDWYDKSIRLNGGSDMGQDVVLFNSGKPVGVVQCKRLRASTLSRQVMLYELCKFFLFARIFPYLTPVAGQKFKYIFSVAKNVHQDGLVFFNSAGSERFNNLRSEIVNIFGSLVKDLKTFSGYPGFANLTPEDICDLVWGSLVEVETSVYRQNDLSDLVRKTPGVYSNYFSLRHVAIVGEELKELIAGYFRSAGAPPNSSWMQLEEDSYTVEIPMFASHNDKVNVVLIQGAGDFALRSLESALGQDDAVKSMVGGRLTVILAGGSAFSCADDMRIEKILGGFSSPVILIAGCGALDGQEINNLKSEPGVVWYFRDFILAASRRYKFGWCWLKLQEGGVEGEGNAGEVGDNKEVLRYPLIVNTPLDPTFESADVGLRLSFNDFIIYPLIDDDMLCSWASRHSVLKRLALGMHEDSSRRRTMICGAVHWDEVSDKHDESISDVLAVRRNLHREVGVFLANSSLTTKFDNEWRSASGYFPSFVESSYLFNRRSSPKGSIFRRDDESYIFFVLRWTQVGIESVIEVPHFDLRGVVSGDIDPGGVELSRHMKWHLPHPHSSLQLHNSFYEFYESLISSNYKKATKLSAGFFYGVQPGLEFSVNDISKSFSKLCEPLQAACYLSGGYGAKWVQHDEYPAHVDYFKFGKSLVSLFLWADRNMSLNQVEAMVSEYSKTGGAAPDLIIFTSVLGDPEPAGRATRSKSRDNIASPASLPGSIAEPNIARKTYLFPMREIQNCYMSGVSESDERAKFFEGLVARKEALDV